MADWDDVRDIVLALPATTQTESRRGTLEWHVGRAAVAWERPLSKADTKALGDAAPTGPVLAVTVEDLGVQQAWLQEQPDVCFLSPHFAGYPAVLLRLDRAGVDLLREVLVEAWLVAAPPHLAEEFLAGGG